MRTREFPVLAGEDEPLVSQLAHGLGDDAARVLGYLLLRQDFEAVDDEPAPADRLAIRVGTGLTRSRLTTAIDSLEERGLVTTTTVRTDQGRPPTAWTARSTVDETHALVDEAHAVALLTQAVAVATAQGSDSLILPSSVDASVAAADFAVGLNWVPNVLHAPLFAARRAGAYDDRGLDVTVEAHTGSDRAIAAVDAGDVDAAVAGAATVTRARAAGVPVVPLAPLYQRAMTVLYTTRDSFGGPFDGIERLRGRRVGMPVDAETGMLCRLFLSQAGLGDEVTVVDLSGEESNALATDRADVVSGTIGDVHALEAAGHTVDLLSVDDHFPVYGPTLVTSEETLHERPNAVAAFLAGTVAGWRVAAADPQTAVEAVATETSVDADAGAVDELEHAVERYGSSNDVTDHGWGWHETTGWQRLSTALDQVGLLDVDRDAEFATQSGGDGR